MIRLFKRSPYHSDIIFAFGRVTFGRMHNQMAD